MGITIHGRYDKGVIYLPSSAVGSSISNSRRGSSSKGKVRIVEG